MKLEDRILEYMKKGNTITSMEAINKFGATRLSAIIFNLKKRNYNISSKTIKGKNRYGDKIHWSEYRLER